MTKLKTFLHKVSVVIILRMDNKRTGLLPLTASELMETCDGDLFFKGWKLSHSSTAPVTSVCFLYPVKLVKNHVQGIRAVVWWSVITDYPRNSSVLCHEYNFLFFFEQNNKCIFHFHFHEYRNINEVLLQRKECYMEYFTQSGEDLSQRFRINKFKTPFHC